MEIAESEFQRFCDEMDLDVDTEVMDAEDKTAFEKIKRRIIKAMQSGALVINENGEAVYTPQRSDYTDPITFHERTGNSALAMDGKKKNEDARKTYAVMGDICKVHPGIFSKLRGTDIKICEGIFTLLMD